MHFSDFWRSDADACRANPNSMFLYNRLDLLAEQSIEAWPLPVTPMSYPVVVDFIMSLDDDDTAVTVHDEVEWNELLRVDGSGGRYWSMKSEALIYVVDAIINKGSVRCCDVFSVNHSRNGLPLRYDHVPGYNLPLGVLQFLSTHLADYVGPVSLRVQEDIIVDLRLRWSTINCIWLRQIDFVKTAPSYATTQKMLRPMTVPLVYIPCWVDDDTQDAAFQVEQLVKSTVPLSLYLTRRENWATCGSYTRVGVFAVSPNDVLKAMAIKREHGLT